MPDCTTMRTTMLFLAHPPDWRTRPAPPTPSSAHRQEPLTPAAISILFLANLPGLPTPQARITHFLATTPGKLVLVALTTHFLAFKAASTWSVATSMLSSAVPPA